MKELEIFDSTFSETWTSDYLLNISVSENSFSYTIFDTKQGIFIAFWSIDFANPIHSSELFDRVYELLTTKSILCQSFKQTNFIFRTANITQIPAEYFDENKFSQIAEFTLASTVFDSIKYNFNSRNNYYIIYSVTNYLHEVLEAQFENLKILTQYNVFNNNLLQFHNEIITLRIENSFFDLLIQKSGKIEFINSYYYHNESEFYYLIDSILQKMNLVKNEIPYLILGQSNRIDFKTEQFAAFFRKQIDFEALYQKKFCKAITSQIIKKYNYLFF